MRSRVKHIKIYQDEAMAVWNKWELWRLAWSMYFRFWIIHLAVMICLGFLAGIFGFLF